MKTRPTTLEKLKCYKTTVSRLACVRVHPVIAALGNLLRIRKATIALGYRFARLLLFSRTQQLSACIHNSVDSHQMNQISNELQDMIYLNWKGDENKFLAAF